jgi:hypothetical protein
MKYKSLDSASLHDAADGGGGGGGRASERDSGPATSTARDTEDDATTASCGADGLLPLASPLAMPRLKCSPPPRRASGWRIWSCRRASAQAFPVPRRARDVDAAAAVHPADGRSARPAVACAVRSGGDEQPSHWGLEAAELSGAAEGETASRWSASRPNVIDRAAAGPRPARSSEARRGSTAMAASTRGGRWARNPSSAGGASVYLCAAAPLWTRRPRDGGVRETALF